MDLRRAVRVGTMAGGIALPFMTHVVLTAGKPAAAAWTLILIQLALAFWFVVAQVKPPYRVLALAGLGGCSIALYCMRLTGGLVLSSGLAHALAYLYLLAMFGASLLPDREPLVTFFARKIHGPLAPGLRKYTRNVTRAWCIFFALQLLGSAVLLTFAPISWWSLFVNVLNAPLVCIMFVVERLGRPLWVANPPREEFANVMELVELMKNRVVSQDPGIR